MDVIIVVDMQAGLLNGPPKLDLAGVIERINRLTALVRERSGTVIWIRHCGKPGEDFAPHAAGWAFLPALTRDDRDIVVEKTLNDPFAGTSLGEILRELAPERVLVTGWATDFCVDATVRSAVSNDHHVVVVADGHTLADRPHLSAAEVIAHHHFVWSGLISNRAVEVRTAAEVAGEARK